MSDGRLIPFVRGDGVTPTPGGVPFVYSGGLTTKGEDGEATEGAPTPDTTNTNPAEGNTEK